MNYEAAISLALQRMKEINRCEYHYEPVIVVATQKELESRLIQVRAYNEFYYLINYEGQTGIEIISDTGYFNADDYLNNTVQEFTGLIQIKLEGYEEPFFLPDKQEESKEEKKPENKKGEAIAKKGTSASSNEEPAVTATEQKKTTGESVNKYGNMKPIEFLRLTIH